MKGWKTNRIDWRRLLPPVDEPEKVNKPIFRLPHEDIKEGNLVFRNLVTAQFMFQSQEKKDTDEESDSKSENE